MSRFFRRSFRRRLLLAVGWPSALATLTGLLWLRHLAGFLLHAAGLDKPVDCTDAALFAAKKAGRYTVRTFETGLAEEPARQRHVALTGQP